MTLAKSFVVLLGLLATSFSKGRTALYSNQQSVVYPPPSQLITQGQQVPWSWQSFPNYAVFPYQQYQVPYTFPTPGFPYSVPPQYPTLARPTVDFTSPVVKEVDVIEQPPVQVPVPNIVPVSNMDAALLELENNGKVHAEKYYYGRSEIPYFPGMMPSYPPATTTQYQYYEIPKYPGVPTYTQFPYSYQQTPYPPAFPQYSYQQQPYVIPSQFQNQQVPYTNQFPDNLPPQGSPQQQQQQQQPPQLPGGQGGAVASPDLPGGGPSSGDSPQRGPGVPISPYLKPNQQLDPDGRPFTVNKRKHVEVYEYH